VGRSRQAALRWKEAEVLIVDEISMLSAELFDKLSYVAQKVRQDDRPFGGLQVILCGDFYQLPPIGVGKDAKFCFESATWEELFGGRDDGMIVLEKVRQYVLNPPLYAKNMYLTLYFYCLFCIKPYLSTVYYV
jgi:ATP-dependent DNA helicase PIF1